MKLRTASALSLSLALFAGPALAAEKEASAIYQGVTEELFQTYIVGMGLEALGYDVGEPDIAQMQASFLAVSNGDASYYPVFWWPLHRGFWEQNGGDEKWQLVGKLVDNSLQGYLIDKATADAHGITSLAQLSDPEIAKLFDIDGNGKADLYGCETGWGCEIVIEHHLDAYGLRDTVEHRQGGYFAIIPDAVERVKSGQSTLYYTWTPLWLSGVLRPGEEVIWLTVPFTSLPDRTDDESATTVDGIGNLGFAVNSQHVIANTDWLNENPVAKKWFELVHIPIGDINAQNMKVNGGESSDDDVRRHAEEWIASNQAQWDGWIAQARAAE